MNKFFSILVFITFFLLMSYCNKTLEKNKSFSKGNIYIIEPLQSFGAIEPAYSRYLKQKLEIVNNDRNSKAVIIKIDTPGGRVDTTEEIINFIQKVRVKTITFIDNSAYSAGAFVSLAADYTVISDTGKIGAATPITMGEKGPKSIEDPVVRAKIYSGLKASIRSLAEKRQKRLNKEISLGNESYLHLKDKNSVRNLDKILEAMISQDVELTMEEDGYTLKKGEVLTLTAKKAYELGIVDGIYNSVDNVLKSHNMHKGYNKIVIKAGQVDNFIAILTNPLTMSILMSLGMLGMIMEFWTPGWGVPGTIGILALSLFFIGQFGVQNPEWSTLVLVMVGFVLLAIEIFVIPGFGIVGVSGIIAILVAFGIALSESSYGGKGLNMGDAVVWVFVTLIATVALVVIFFKFLPKTKTFSKIALVDGQIGSTSHEISYDEIIDKEGIALTILRPSGIASINGKRYDVVTAGEFINKNDSIKVVHVEKGKVIVKKNI